MTDTRTYGGSCHCGAVKYRVTMKLEGAVTCNCSMCQRSGTVLAFAPATTFELLQGEEHLTDYQWGKKRIHHLFCDVCGIKPFARAAAPDGSPVVAVNVRCLEGVDLDGLPKQHFDGRSIPV